MQKPNNGTSSERTDCATPHACPSAVMGLFLWVIFENLDECANDELQRNVQLHKHFGPHLTIIDGNQQIIASKFAADIQKTAKGQIYIPRLLSCKGNREYRENQKVKKTMKIYI